jgi:hypothetical protein
LSSGPCDSWCGMLYASVDSVESIPFATGLVSVSFSVPNDARLIGLTFFQQALGVCEGGGVGPLCPVTSVGRSLSVGGRGVVGA